MKHERRTVRKWDGGRAADCVLRFLLAVILFAARMFGGYAPFAVGFLAAAGGGWSGIAALLGGALGAALFLDFTHALRSLAIGILLYAANNAFVDRPVARKPFFLPILTAALSLSVEFVYLLRGGIQASDFFFAVTVSAFAAYWFHIALNGGSRRPTGTLLLLTGVVAAFSSFSFGGFAPGRVAALLLVMLLAFDRDAATAVAGALCIGLCMDFIAADTVFFRAVAYSVGTLSMSTRRRGKRTVAVLLFLFPIALLSLSLAQRQGALLLYECCGASLIFLLLPEKWFRGRRITLREPDVDSVSAAIRRRLEQSAAALREIYESFSHGEHLPENPSVIFDRAAERVCRGCPICATCWKKEYRRTYTALSEAAPRILSAGEGRGEDFPAYFSDRCVRFSSFLGAVNNELSAYLIRRQYRERIARERADAAVSYAQASELLRSAAGSVDAVKAAAVRAKLPYQIGSALHPKGGEHVSGDSAISFVTDTGELCLILSDGMGSGEAARKESSLAVRLLERFLRAGIDAEPALKTLNGALTFKAAESGAFTTVDLLRLSLQSGEATVYKYGAAPSYVKHGGRVRRITCSCLPAGLQDAAHPPEATHLRLTSGTFFVMVTDGIADANDDEWLQNLLAGWDGENPQSLVAAILADSQSHHGTADDGGVIVLYLPKDTLMQSGEI